MCLVISYLLKINWTTGFPVDIVELKLQHLVTKLKLLQCILKTCFAIYIDGLSDEQMYLIQHKLSTLLQSIRTLQILLHLNLPSSAKWSRISTPIRPTRLANLYQNQLLTQMHPRRV